VKIEVFDNQIETALKQLKKQMLKDGIFQEMKKRAHYEKPSVKRKRKAAQARKKRRKALKRGPGVRRPRAAARHPLLLARQLDAAHLRGFFVQLHRLLMLAGLVKRHRLGGFGSRFGRLPVVALSELGIDLGLEHRALARAGDSRRHEHERGAEKDRSHVLTSLMVRFDLDSGTETEPKGPVVTPARQSLPGSAERTRSEVNLGAGL